MVKNKIEGKHILIGLAILLAVSYTGIGNSIFMGALMDEPYTYESCRTEDGQKMCETKFISCDSNEDCQEACLGDSTWKWIAEQTGANSSVDLTDTQFYKDIMDSYCNSQGRCVVSEYCIYTGAMTDYIKQNPWAWMQEHPIYALAIVAGTIAYFAWV